MRKGSIPLETITVPSMSVVVPIMLLVSIRTMEGAGRSRKWIRLHCVYLMSIGLAYFVWQLRT